MDEAALARAAILGLSAVFFLLGLPLALRKVPPNGVYGFRTRTTLQGPSFGYPVNAFYGRCLLVAGLASALGALWVFGPSGPGGKEPMSWTLPWLVVPQAAAIAAGRAPQGRFWRRGRDV